MKLYRFMSGDECEKLVKGEKLENHTDHSELRGTASTSRGFCFGVGDKEQARKDFRRLKGIVDGTILFVGNVKPEREGGFSLCQGRYIDYDRIEAEGKTIDDYPRNDMPLKMCDEYCTESYSTEDFEDYRLYGFRFDLSADPSDMNALKLRELGAGDSSVPFSDDPDLNKGCQVSKEIIKLLYKHQGLTAGQSFIALALSTNFVLETIVKNEEVTLKQCLDDYVGLLKTLATRQTQE